MITQILTLGVDNSSERFQAVVEVELETMATLRHKLTWLFNYNNAAYFCTESNGL
jgi:hypothetical protein